MALFAGGDVRLNDALRDPLKAINSGAQDKLQAALGMLGTRQKASSMASGRVMGEYAPAELNRAGQTASTGIEDKLLGALGDASYDEFKKVQDHKRNMALAEEIGRLSSPSTLEEVLGGLGGAAKAGGQFTALYKGMNKGGGGGVSLPPKLSLYDPGSFGYARYQ